MSNKKIKVVVINVAGSAGKSTFTKHGLCPLIKGAIRVAVEDWNTGDGVSDLEINAKAFHTLATQLNVDVQQNFVIDVGTSNSKSILKQFDELALTRDEIDYWVVPVRTGAKEALDTLKTISMLMAMEIQATKIVVIAQAITDVDTFNADFASIIDAAEATGFCFAKQAVLYSDIYDLLKNKDESVFDLVRDKPDFGALRREHKDDEAKLLEIGHQMLLYSLSHTACRNLLAVFQSTPMFAAVDGAI